MSGGDHNNEARWEWQIAEGSSTAHVIDEAGPKPKRTGPAALCGRRPQRYRGWWYALEVTEPDAKRAIRGFACTPCPDCEDKIRGEVSS